MSSRELPASSPLHIAEQGFFWVGIQRQSQAYGTTASGQAYVQYQVPVEVRHPYPIVMVHGGGGQGLDWIGTPDGRPGWATFFLRRGYSVYVIDRTGLGRAPFHEDTLGPATRPPTYENISARFSAPARAGAYPRAGLHTQWPGSGEIGDPALDQFLASQGPNLSTLAANQEAMRRCGAELLDRLGPCVLMTHSMGGAFGWVVADARPQLVKGIVACEPIAPPFMEIPGFGRLDWGLTAVPLTYDPPVSDPSELATETRPAGAPDLVDALVQREPARRLSNLSGFPIAVVAAEASWMAQHTHGVVDYLVQAGADAEHIRLEELGIRGNGHLMMGERNSDEIATVLAEWIERRVEVPDGQRGRAGELRSAWYRGGVSAVASTALPGASARVQFVLDDCPDGVEDRYYVEIVNGTIAESRADTFPDPDVIAVLCYADALRVQGGETDVEDLLLSGHLSYRGSLSSLKAVFPVLCPKKGERTGAL